MLLIYITDKGFVLCSTDNYICELLFSSILEKYIFCDVRGLRSPSFESSAVLYITPTDNASMQELVLQEHKQLRKTCSCKKCTWHIEFIHILQPPKYVVIIVNRFNYIDNKNRSLEPLDMDSVPGPYNFNLGLLHIIMDIL